MFRQVRGKTILSGKGSSSRKQSALQRENRQKFKQASRYAKAVMLDADKKAYYWRKAKKLKLPNAYTAALSDYMRKGEIKDINTKRYAGKAGDAIYIQAGKKDFAVNTVVVSLYDANGVLIEYGNATKTDQSMFVYKARVNAEGMVRVCAVVREFRFDCVEKEVVVG